MNIEEEELVKTRKDEKNDKVNFGKRSLKKIRFRIRGGSAATRRKRAVAGHPVHTTAPPEQIDRRPDTMSRETLIIIAYRLFICQEALK